MKTNGAGSDGSRELECAGIDRLPSKIKQMVCDAPINLGAWGIAEHFRRMRISEPWEIEAYAADLRVKIDNMMRSDAAYSTNAFWKNHPQMDPAYQWPDWQPKPKRNRNRLANTRIAEIGTNVDKDR